MEEQKPTLPSPPSLEGVLEQTVLALRELGPGASMSAKAFRELVSAWDMASLQCRRISSQLSAQAKELRYKAEALRLEMPDELEEPSDED